jgi:hypothetical protein
MLEMLHRWLKVRRDAKSIAEVYAAREAMWADPALLAELGPEEHARWKREWEEDIYGAPGHPPQWPPRHSTLRRAMDAA